MGESSFGARGQLTPDRGRGAGEVAGVGGSGALSGILNPPVVASVEEALANVKPANNKRTRTSQPKGSKSKVSHLNKQ